MIKEWNLLRTIACLSVVLLHTTTQIGRHIGYINIESYFSLRVILTYATPTFIVLSEIILANKYKGSLPKNFLKKRCQFILLPFISFAIIDALVVNYMSLNGIDIFSKIVSNLMGNFIGYFILIIFQFYILHYIILRFRLSIEKFLPWSILIMAIHLLILNSDIPFVMEHKAMLKIPFTAWIGYFFVAFFIGKHYTKIAPLLKRFKWLTLIGVVYMFYFIQASIDGGATLINSRRLDIFPLSLAISAFILAWGQVIPASKTVNLISNYSLGIYLIHWQVQRLLTPVLVDHFGSLSPTLLILSLFVTFTALSMVVIKLISLLPFGKYVIGNTKRKYTTPVKYTDKEKAA